MDLTNHALRVVEKLGALMLNALMLANLSGLMIIARDRPDLTTAFLIGFVLAMLSSLVIYVLAQVSLTRPQILTSLPLFMLGMAAGVLSAVSFVFAVLAAASGAA